MKELVISVLLVAVAMVLLSVRVILKRNGRFGSQHISQNKRMREKGIHCAVSQDREARSQHASRLNIHEL